MKHGFEAISFGELPDGVTDKVNSVTPVYEHWFEKFLGIGKNSHCHKVNRRKDTVEKYFRRSHKTSRRWKIHCEVAFQATTEGIRLKLHSCSRSFKVTKTPFDSQSWTV